MRLLSLFLLLLFHAVVGGVDVGVNSQSFVVIVGALLATAPDLFGFEDSDSDNDDEPVDRLPPRKRARRHVHSIFEKMGPYYQQRAYRMPDQSFWTLLQLIKPYMKCGLLKPKTNSKKKNQKNGATNGFIPKSIRFSCALRYFAGGAVDDIAIVHRVSNTEVYDSVWFVVDAVKKCPQLAISARPVSIAGLATLMTCFYGSRSLL